MLLRTSSLRLLVGTTNLERIFLELLLVLSFEDTLDLRMMEAPPGLPPVLGVNLRRRDPTRPAAP